MTRFALILALLTGGLTGNALRASAVDAPGEMRVTDEAGLFTTDGIAKAKAAFDEQQFHGHVRFGIHTVKGIPESKQSDFDAMPKNEDNLSRFFSEWAQELARKEGSKADVYVLVYWTGKAYYSKCISNRLTDVGRGFNDAKARDVDRRFATALRSVLNDKLTGDALHSKLDGALNDATLLVIEDLKNTSVATTKNRTNSAVSANNHEGNGIMGYVCIGIAGLLGVWLVIGLIRAFTGGGGGGMGGGGMGGGYGGGGGGFMSSMFGGLFGSMAGMYMYNNFFGGNHSNLGATDSMGNDAGTYDTGDGDYSGGASGGEGGGDWGDTSGDAGGGGDWGGDTGGGDFGGGDAGGGGDW